MKLNGKTNEIKHIPRTTKEEKREEKQTWMKKPKKG